MRMWDRDGAFIEPRPASVCSAEVAAVALAATSTGMTIIGGIQQANAQQAAGQVALQNAQMRNQLAQQQAPQERAAALQEEAGGKRQAPGPPRQAQITASKAKAIMAASGASVDDNIVAGILGEGDYAAGVANWNASARATNLRNKASLDSWAGSTGLDMGNYENQVAGARAQNTIISTIGKATLDFATKYGGQLFDTGSKYSLADDKLRTANDADLAGYGASLS